MEDQLTIYLTTEHRFMLQLLTPELLPTFVNCVLLIVHLCMLSRNFVLI